MSATPSKLYESRLASLALAAGPPRRRFPLPQNAPIQFDAYAFDQELEMLLAHPTSGAILFPPCPKNTPSNATSGGSAIFAGLLDANAILTKLSQPSPTGGGRGKFTGSFMRVPASWDDYKTAAVTFPGWLNTVFSGLARKARTRTVNIRERYDYFVVDPTGILNGGTAPSGVVNGTALDSSGASVQLVSVMGAIPSKLRNVWLNTLSGTPEANSEVNDLVPSGGATIGTETYIPTFPTTNQYQTMISNAAAALASHPWNGSYPVVWNGTAAGANGAANAGQYQFADSTLRVLEGNVIERCTPYVIPQ